MIPERFIYNTLVNSSVASVVADRIVPAPAIVTLGYPLVTYQRTATQSLEHLGGGSGLSQARFVIHVWGQDFAVVADLAEMIRIAFQGKVDPQYNVQYVQFVTDLADFDEDERAHGRILEILIWHTEPIPS